MKKALLLVFVLFFQPLFAKPRNGENWGLYQTGRYWYVRSTAFEQGIAKLDDQRFTKSARLFRKSLTCTFRFNYPAYNNYAVSVAGDQNYRQAEGLLCKSINSGGDPVIAHYNLFVCRLNQKKYDTADDYFHLLPDYVRSEHAEETANYLANSGQLEAAYPYFQTALQEDEQTIDHATFFNACLSAWAVNDTDFAISSINSAIAARPRQANYHLQKAKVYLGIDAGIAEKEFRKTLQLDPSNLEARLGWVYALLTQGKGREALSLIENTAKKHPEAISADWLQVKAIALSQTGNTEDALTTMQQVSAMRSFTAYDHKIMGDLYLNTDSLEAADNHYQLALTDTFIGDARLGQAIVAFLQDRLEDAGQILSALHSQHPDYIFSAYAYYLESVVYYAQGNYTGFESSIDNASYSRNRESAKLLIQAMKAFSRYEYYQADKLLRKALRLDPENLNLHLALGSLQYQVGDIVAATATFKNALHQDPSNTEIKNMLALSLSASGSTSSAIQLMIEVLNAKPSARYFNNMAMIYAMIDPKDNKKYPETCGYYETALEYMDSAFAAGLDTVFQLNRANITLSLGDTVKAKQMMLDMNHPFAINNYAALGFLEGDFASANRNINNAIEACNERVPSILKYNEYVIGKQRFSEDEVRFIYLYQFLPAVLPDKHPVSYSFQLNSEAPEHADGDFVVYTDLHGQPETDATRLATR